MPKSWRGRRVLITGFAGFIGANVTRALLDLGAEPLGVDRAGSSPSLRALGADCQAVVADVTDLATMQAVMEQARPEVVFHLAGVGHIKDAQEAPYQAFSVNALGTVAVLEAVRRAAPGAAVVVASSNEVYPAGGPWHEEHEPEPRTVYGWSKSCQDKITRAYGKSLGLSVAGLRHANAVGPANPHGSHLVQSVIGALLEGEVIRLRSDGSPRKAYVAVEDVGSAYLLLAEGLLGGRVGRGTVWNAGSDETPSVREVAEILVGFAAVPVEIQCGPSDHESGYHQTLDSSRLHALGWMPRPLRETLQVIYKWYSEHAWPHRKA